jgi:hypothetical protein
MNITKRRFLQSALAAGVSLVIEGFPRAAYTFGGSTVYREAPEHQRISGLDDRQVKILHYGSLAPSGHNTQPWTLRLVDENQWIIGIDPGRHLSATDPENRIVLLSLGAFVENLCLAAGAFGLAAETEVIAKTPHDHDVLRVRLKETRQTGYPLARMEKRMTVKKGYLQKEIDPKDVDAFSKLTGSNLFYFPRGTTHADCIEEGAVENFRIQVKRDQAQKELVRWLRLRDKEIEKYRDGLTVAGMEITGLKGWFVRHFVGPDDFFKESFKQQSIDHTATLAGQGGGWFVITSDGHSVYDILDAGRKFERIALAARERKIALQPMTQYLEEKQGINEIRENHAPEIRPQFVIRVGYLDKYPEPVSPRRPISWFVVT